MNLLEDRGPWLGMPAQRQTVTESIFDVRLCYFAGPLWPRFWGRFSLPSHLWDGWVPLWDGVRDAPTLTE